jgi:DNA-binding beta-propeller fold protein YncE
MYLQTIGGPGHAEMYPSGLDVDPAGKVYVADTGNDQVKAYSSSGALLWTTGARGPKALGVFVNPRDLAYLDGKLYVGDTGNGRIQVLDAATGTPLAEWTGFGSIMGVSAGVSAHGKPIVLVTQDNRHLVARFTPNGAPLNAFGTGPGSGDGQLSAPRDAATDAAGNLYVADYLNNRIAKFGPTGAWLANWGRTGSADGRFQRPYGVAVGDGGGVYVADSNNHRIQKFSPGGVFLSKWGVAGSGPGEFSHLRRVAVGAGPTPDVYGADLFGLKIERFAQSGELRRTYGGTPFPDGLFNEPSGLAVGSSDVFVVDAVNQRVQRLDLGGTFELAFGHRGWGSDLLGFNWPRDVVLNGITGTLWAADTKNNVVKEFTTGGVPTGRSFGGSGSAIGKLSWPSAIAAAGEDVVVANTNNGRVERWSTDLLEPIWAATGFRGPKDLSVRDGVVYVADTSNSRIVRLDAADGSLIDAFGAGVLVQPAGVAVRGNGHVWVSDSGNNRLVEFGPDGSFVREFGALGAAHGSFNNPTKLELAGRRLFVTDEWNDRIEVFEIG